MVVTRFKPLFSVSAKYELASIGITDEGIQVEPFLLSDALMNDLKLRSKTEKNISTVFYEGIETPADVPVTSEPLLTIDDERYFYFQLGFTDKSKIKGLKFHSSDNVAKNIGFPVLFHAAISTLNGPAVITSIEDAKMFQPVFTLAVKKTDTGSTAQYISLEIRDEKNDLVELNIPPAALNNDATNGPEYSFSIDASLLEPGIYTFKAGNFSKKIFLTTKMDVTDAVGIVRVLKNDFLTYKKNLSDSSFAKFELTIPKK